MTAASAPNVSPLRLFLIAGEVSGDHLGAELIKAIRTERPDAIMRGVGGARMAAEGFNSLFPLEDIAVMGFLPVIARLPQLLRRIRETAQAVIDDPPDALIIIDSPDFTHRVARRVRAALPHIPIVDYVSPTVWAWRPGRAKKMRAYVDHVLALLPFEPQAHRRLGGPACSYVGHPLIEQFATLRPNAQEALRRDAEPPVVLALPGSRRSEVTRLLDTFGETLAQLQARVGEIDVVLPAVPHLVDLIRAQVAGWRVQPRIVVGEAEKYAAFRIARAALAASGTVSLELALAQIPMVVAYKVSKLEEMIVRQLVQTKWAALPNIILEAGVVPERLQEEANPAALAALLGDLVQAGPARQAQLDAFVRLDAMMQLEGGMSPAARAAQVVLDTIKR